MRWLHLKVVPGALESLVSWNSSHGVWAVIPTVVVGLSFAILYATVILIGHLKIDRVGSQLHAAVVFGACCLALPTAIRILPALVGYTKPPYVDGEHTSSWDGLSMALAGALLGALLQATWYIFPLRQRRFAPSGSRPALQASPDPASPPGRTPGGSGVGEKRPSDASPIQEHTAHLRSAADPRIRQGTPNLQGAMGQIGAERPVSAYLQAQQALRHRPYSPVLQVAQVHVRLPGMQPEQLQTTWQAVLQERLAEQGWHLLNAAARRGSIRVSFSVADVRNEPAARVAAPASTAREAPTADNSSNSNNDSNSNNRNCNRSTACPVSSFGRPGALPPPEELLARLGMRSENLLEGFCATIQVIEDDGICFRVKCTLQPDRTWVQAPIAGMHVSSPSTSDGPSGSTRLAAAHVGTGQRDKVYNTCYATNPLGNRRGETDNGNVCVVGTSRLAHAELEPAPHGQGEDAAAADMCASKLCWRIQAPHVVMGTPASGAEQRYKLRVTAVPAAPGWCGARSNKPDFNGAANEGSDRSAVVRQPPYSMLEFRVRPLNLAGEVVEFRLSQTRLRSATSGSGTSPSRRASGTGSGASVHAAALGAASGRVEDHYSGDRVEHSNDIDGGAVLDNAGGAVLNNAATMTMDALYGGTWALTVWDTCMPPLPPSGGPPALLASLPEHEVQNSGDNTNDDSDGNTDVSVNNSGGTHARPSQPPESGSLGHQIGPYLVDLSMWCGPDLLAACVVLLVPAARNGGQTEPIWVTQLNQLLVLHSADVAQHILVDLGLLLSGALCAAQPASGALPGSGGPVAAALEGTLPTVPEEPVATSARSGGGAAGRRLLLTLDLGCNLLSLVLKHGACALAEELWASLQRCGFGAEEVLLQAAGSQWDVPLLHAATASGQYYSVVLVLSWYEAARLPEPWLQPVQLSGHPPVLTPLVLAAAASPNGSLLSCILRNHAQARAAWRVPVNGASGRSSAVVGGLRRVVMVADMYHVLAALAGARDATAGWFRRQRQLWFRHQWQVPFKPQLQQWQIWFRCPVADPRLRRAAGHVADGAQEVPLASANECEYGPPKHLPSPATSRDAMQSGGEMLRCFKGAEFPDKKNACRSRRRDLRRELDRFVAQRTRTQMILFQSAIIIFQMLAQLKAITTAFEATCPSAAALDRWTWLAVTRATYRCVAGRLWWTAIEAAVLVALVSPWGSRYYTAGCVATSATRVMFQAGEGLLLPASEMSAVGGQMLIAHVLFVLIVAVCYQPAGHVNVILRVLESLSGARMYVKYGVTHSPLLALAQTLCVCSLGGMVSGWLRQRADYVLRRQVELQQQLQGSLAMLPEWKTTSTGAPLPDGLEP